MLFVSVHHLNSTKLHDSGMMFFVFSLSCPVENMSGIEILLVKAREGLVLVHIGIEAVITCARKSGPAKIDMF